MMNLEGRNCVPVKKYWKATNRILCLDLSSCTLRNKARKITAEQLKIFLYKE